MNPSPKYFVPALRMAVLCCATNAATSPRKAARTASTSSLAVRMGQSLRKFRQPSTAFSRKARGG